MVVFDWITRFAFWGTIFCNLYFTVRNVREVIRYRRARDIHESATKQLTQINEIHKRLCQLELKWFEAASIGKREVSEFYHEELCKVSDELKSVLEPKHDA
jgi:hypothetical protein